MFLGDVHCTFLLRELKILQISPNIWTPTIYLNILTFTTQSKFVDYSKLEISSISTICLRANTINLEPQSVDNRPNCTKFNNKTLNLTNLITTKSSCILSSFDCFWFGRVPFWWSCQRVLRMISYKTRHYGGKKSYAFCNQARINEGVSWKCTKHSKENLNEVRNHCYF